MLHPVVPPLDVTVMGQAALLTSPTHVAEPWKQRVVQAVRPAWPGPPLRQPCTVRLTFSMVPARYHDTALANLLKVIIDALGSVIFAPASAPVRDPRAYHAEDWWIDEIVAKKQQTLAEPNARIELLPVGTLPEDAAHELLVQGFVPGSPPLLAGDNAGLYAHHCTPGRPSCSSDHAGATVLPAPPDMTAAPATCALSDM